MQDFLAPLPVGRLPGVGRVMEARLAGLGIASVSDLRGFALDDLERRFVAFLTAVAEATGVDGDPAPIAAQIRERAERAFVGMADAEARTLSFLQEWVPASASPMCGNSICQDRRFLHRLMPKLEQHFHYRNLDVSTLKELARRWAPQVLAGMRKESAHTALSDVRDSIDELRYYRKNLAALVAP